MGNMLDVLGVKSGREGVEGSLGGKGFGSLCCLGHD